MPDVQQSPLVPAPPASLPDPDWGKVKDLAVNHIDRLDAGRRLRGHLCGVRAMKVQPCVVQYSLIS